MSEIQVTTATLISKAEELNQLNEQFKKAVESLTQEEQAKFFIANTILAKGDFPPILDLKKTTAISL